MEAKLVYKTKSCKAEFDIANLVVRAYQDTSAYGTGLIADVIYTYNAKRVVKTFSGKSPQRLAEAAADFVNDNMLDSDIILCVNELPVQTRTNAECAEQFKQTFCAEVDAITDAQRSIRDAEERKKERLKQFTSPFSEMRLERQKQLIFGDKQ